MKHLYILRSAGLGKIFFNLCNNSMVLLILFDTLFKCCQMLNYYPMLILNVFEMMPEKNCC